MRSESVTSKLALKKVTSKLISVFQSHHNDRKQKSNFLRQEEIQNAENSKFSFETYSTFTMLSLWSCSIQPSKNCSEKSAS